MKSSFLLFLKLILAIFFLFFKFYQLITFEHYIQSKSNQNNSNKNVIRSLNKSTAMNYTTELISGHNFTHASQLPVYLAADYMIDNILVKITKYQNELEPHCNPKLQNWLVETRSYSKYFEELINYENPKNLKNLKNIHYGKNCDEYVFSNNVRYLDLFDKNGSHSKGIPIRPQNSHNRAKNINITDNIFNINSYCSNSLHVDPGSWKKVKIMAEKLLQSCNLEEYFDTKLLLLQITTYISTNECLGRFFFIAKKCESNEFIEMQKKCFRHVFFKNSKYIFNNFDLKDIESIKFNNADLIDIINKDQTNALLYNKRRSAFIDLVNSCMNFQNYNQSLKFLSKSLKTCETNAIGKRNKTFFEELSFTDIRKPIYRFCSNVEKIKEKILLNLDQYVIFYEYDVWVNLELPTMLEIIAFKNKKESHSYMKNFSIKYSKDNEKMSECEFNILSNQNLCKMFEEIYFSAELFHKNFLINN
ncbi:hypothetical protein EDEG_01449 [Edhazardia aedis USNM 41457]|uniref:Uncharacterized protein n=1 Tax=Edhazardia aedis (strain USNM 41457) TaxID=1003232 RepID=J9DSH6_EDHAE|nr:hypothetical protein EDEG_01449 [Edhazardia aedis USNM 41457]|eukprot:EJW04277.1 hypothetical protein EDEG_01449 [Edhazardia aedis USNM 41457]